MSAADADGVVRQATATDVDAILDLLAHLDWPLEHLRPRYEPEAGYEPEQSWVVEKDGRVVAHLRVYDRTLRLADGKLPIAGIGEVATDRDHRRRHYADRLLAAALSEAEREGYAYSLLWTAVPELYARHGYGPAPEQVVTATIPTTGAARANVRVFRPDDLPAVAALYDRVQARRTGTAIRDLAYWRASLTWSREDPDGFLVALPPGGGPRGGGDGDEVVAYLRSRHRGGELEVLELTAEDPTVARTLLTTAAAPTHGRVRATLPRSSFALLGEDQEIHVKPGLMGRPLRLPALSAALRSSEPRTRRRATVLPGEGTSVRLGTSDGITDEVSPGPLTHLLLWGHDSLVAPDLDTRADAPRLRELFPPQDGVIWPVDTF